LPAASKIPPNALNAVTKGVEAAVQFFNRH